jgi:glycosyltransferase involved in cell wall biosynthesis
VVQAKSIKPFFSIITCTRNSARFLPASLDSVSNQTFQDFEHIIIDGESTDNTIKLLRSRKLPFISAVPRGIANAMNIGLAKTRGKYIYFLNSDDSFYSPDVLQSVYDYLISHPDLDWAFGNIHETDGKVTIGFPPRRRIFQGKHPQLLKFYNYIPHQATFVKKTVFDQFGGFDESLKSMMDPEYWLRIAPHTKWDYMPIIVANYLIRPDSQSENLDHSASNTREYQLVQHKYLSQLEIIVANFINRILR